MGGGGGVSLIPGSFQWDVVGMSRGEWVPIPCYWHLVIAATCMVSKRTLRSLLECFLVICYTLFTRNVCVGFKVKVIVKVQHCINGDVNPNPNPNSKNGFSSIRDIWCKHRTILWTLLVNKALLWRGIWVSWFGEGVVRREVRGTFPDAENIWQRHSLVILWE